MGLTDVGFMRYSLVADHYQQIALVGMIAIVAAAALLGGFNIVRAAVNSSQLAVAGSMVCVIGDFDVATIAALCQSDCVVSKHDREQSDCWMAYNNLGNALRQVGQTDEAIAQYEAAIQGEARRRRDLQQFGQQH